jgi:hypothetical protein
MSGWWTGFARTGDGAPTVLFIPGGALVWQFTVDDALPPVPDTLAGLEALWERR